MIFIYIVFIVLLFVITIQYFQFKEKKKPIPILFISLFLISIVVIFLISKHTQTLDINTNVSWVEKIIFLFLFLAFSGIVILKYIFLKSKKKSTRIDRFWIYQSFALVLFIFISLFCVYYIQTHKKNLKTQCVEKSLFLKNGVCFSDTSFQNKIQYIVGSLTKNLHLAINSMDKVYCFLIPTLSKQEIVIPGKEIILTIDTPQDTIYFLVK